MKPFISTLILFASLATTAHAAEPTFCMPAAEMEAALVDWYDERPVAENASEREELWVSEQTGTWTMVEYAANGQACVLAQGDDWIASQNLLLAELRD